MDDFYFAGNHCARIQQFIKDNDANVLCSYINDIKAIPTYFNYKDDGWKGKLLIDNGAYTMYRNGTTIDIDAYIKWLNDNDKYIDYAIALDDIPGIFGESATLDDVQKSAQITYDNYMYMKERVVSPHKLLPVYHQGDDIKWLHKYLDMDDLDYMCLSANKSHTTNVHRERFYTECFSVIKASKHPNMKCHCLGSATFQNAEKFPFVSMDATTHIKYAIYGWLMTPYGLVYGGDDLATIKNMPAEAHDRLAKLCEKYGLDINVLGSDWLERTIFNACYVRDKMKTAVCKVQSFKPVRRLF